MADRDHLDILYVGMLPPHPGGSGVSWSQILSGFGQRGHSVRALCPITPGSLDAGDDFANDHPEIDVTRFFVPHFYTGPNIPASTEYRRLENEQIREKLARLILERRPDIVIIGRETFALHVPDLARRHSLPCLLGIRGNTTVAILNRTYPENLAQELLAQFRKADLLVSVADHMAEGLRRRGFANITVIPNFVDLKLFSPGPKDATLLADLDIRDDRIVIVHVSNLKAAKRPLDIVKSAREALQQNPRLVYVIVGDGAYRRAMEDYCREKHIFDRFRFVGWVDYTRVPAYISLADLVVMPSETEGLSRVYLETQASARVLLASDIAPAREVVVDGQTGLLFRKGDVADLTTKVLIAAGDSELRNDIARQARERVSRHGVDQSVAVYVAILRDCIRGFYPVAVSQR